MPEIPPADVLLCERCGYRIGELSVDLPCPECGKPIAESLPERRTVYPTIWQTLTRPRWSLDHMRIDERGRREGRRRAVLAAGCLWAGAALVWLGAFLLEPSGIGRVAWFALLALSAVLPLGGVIAFRVLTSIEQRGLQFFGRRRSLRITPVLAAAVCGYGSAGWPIAAAGAGLLIGVTTLTMVPAEGAAGALSGRLGEGWIVPMLMFVGGALLVAGFLFFEVFAAMGMQRCRFANQAREAEDGAANPGAAGGEQAPGRPDTSPTIDHAATPTDATDPDR